MANTDNNTIQLSISSQTPLIEGTTTTDILPGMLLEQTSGWPTNNLQPYKFGYKQRCVPLFAVEDLYDGRDINATYLVGSRVYARHCRGGDVVLAWLASGEVAEIGSFLASGTNGTLVVGLNEFIEPAALVGVALEAVSSGGQPARITVACEAASGYIYTGSGIKRLYSVVGQMSGYISPFVDSSGGQQVKILGLDVPPVAALTVSF